MIFLPIYAATENQLLEQNEPNVNISRPQILYIMADEDGELVIPKNLKYFCQPELPLDLKLGYETYKVWNDGDSYNSSTRKFEKYLIENNGRCLFENKTKKQFCTSRNVLKCIMQRPYNCSGWTINAIKFQNVIYLIKEDRKERRKSLQETYHFKFQQYCFSDSPFEMPRTEEPADENKQIFGMFRTNIDDIELLYSAEIVGMESEHEIKDFKNIDILNNCRFVMTKLLSEKHSLHWIKNQKVLTAWIQCYLTAVDRLYVGFRTECGRVNRKLEYVETGDIPNGQLWNPEVCKRFMRNFLVKVQEEMSEIDCPYTVYQFNSDSNLKMLKYRVCEGKTEHSFLSEEFIQYMKNK